MTPIHCCILQEPGDVAGLRFLDHARAAIAQVGQPATFARNRLVFDALNLVFGARAAFEELDHSRHAVLFAGEAIDRHAIEHATGAYRPAPRTPWRPERIQIGSGKDYLSGWLNLDILESTQPDALLDMSLPLELPYEFDSTFAGRVRLEAGHAKLLYANNVLEHVHDLPRFMTQCLALLGVGGEFIVEVPYEHANEAWQDPTHVRAFNENSWLYWTTWSWYFGWLEHRFELADLQYLDERLEPCGQPSAKFMRVLLRKVENSEAERQKVRSIRQDFGGLVELVHPHPHCPRVLNAP